MARVRDDTTVNINEATEYIRSFVRFVDIPIRVNNTLVSQQQPETAVQGVVPAYEVRNEKNQLDGTLTADTHLQISAQGEVWIAIRSIVFRGEPISGEVVLRQGLPSNPDFEKPFRFGCCGG